jgi:hypothetical protein
LVGPQTPPNQLIVTPVPGEEVAEMFTVGFEQVSVALPPEVTTGAVVFCETDVVVDEVQVFTASVTINVYVPG